MPAIAFYLMEGAWSMIQKLTEARSLGEATHILVENLPLTEENFGMDVMWIISILLISCMFAAMIVRIAWWATVDVPRYFREDRDLRNGKTVAKGGANQKSKKASAGGTSGKQQQTSAQEKRDTTPAPAEGKVVAATPAPAPSDTKSSQKQSMRRTRALNRTQPTSVIRGFPAIDTLETSPCQRFLAVTSRRKGRAHIYPQNDNRAFMERGKELQNKHFVDICETVRKCIGDRPPEVSKLSFSRDGTRVAVAESITDAIYVFSIDSKGKLLQLWTYKMPRNMVVSTLPRWKLGGDTNELLVFFHDKECEIEIIHHKNGPIGKEKFRVGAALSWAHRGTTVATSGSFMKQARVADIAVRPDASSFVLKHSFHTDVVRCEDKTVDLLGDTTTIRVTAVALVSSGAPEFNTRNYLVTFMEDGNGYVYDMSGPRDDTLTLVGRFQDADFAGYHEGEPLHMTTCVYGGNYHEKLSVALWRGSDISVHRQVPSASGVFKLSHVSDVHDAQDGDPIASVCFVQNGNGLATAGFDDDRHVRLWTLPPL